MFSLSGVIMDYRLELIQNRFSIIDGVFSYDELQELESELDNTIAYNKNNI